MLQTAPTKGQLWSWCGAAPGAVREDSERGGRKAVAFGLLAWRDALREVRAFLKAPSAPGTGGSCVIHPPRYWDYHYCY